METSNQEWLHAYTAQDERLLSWQVGGAEKIRWTLRGLDQQVLREFVYDRPTETGVVERDNVHRGVGGPLLMSQGPLQTTHFHVDHLGTPRLLTDHAGAQVAFHAYYPYGEEATDPEQNEIRYKFTGHERDLAEPTSTADDLDHMHARMTNPQLGRFLSVDPTLVLGRAMRRPQAWNRYTYVVGNPLKYADPTGEIFELGPCAESGTSDKCQGQKDLLASSLGASASQTRVNVDGTVSLASGVSGAEFAAQGDFQKGLLTLIGASGTFTLITDSGEARSTGGGRFLPDNQGGGTIYLESSRLRDRTGDVMGTPQTALVHEIGHALRQVFPEFFDATNARFLGGLFQGYLHLARTGEGYAVNFENRYRRDHGLEIRYSYNRTSPGIRVDFGIALFPPE